VRSVFFNIRSLIRVAKERSRRKLSNFSDLARQETSPAATEKGKMEKPLSVKKKKNTFHLSDKMRQMILQKGKAAQL